MSHIMKSLFIITLAATTCFLLTAGNSVWAEANTHMDLNLSPEQIKALETII